MVLWCTVNIPDHSVHFMSFVEFFGGQIQAFNSVSSVLYVHKITENMENLLCDLQLDFGTEPQNLKVWRKKKKRKVCLRPIYFWLTGS